MNEVIKNMEERRSVRGYKPDMIKKEDLDTIIEAGTYAATGMGMQSPIIVAVTDKATRDQLSAMNAKIMGTDTDPFYGAPVVLIVLADKARPTYLYDGSLVMGNLMNAAHSLGIGSCWIHRAKEEFESEEGKALLKNGESKETMKESVIAYLDMRQQNFLQQNQEKKIMSIM